MNLPNRAIHTAEEIFQFIKDLEQERRKEILLQDEVERLSMRISTINLN